MIPIDPNRSKPEESAYVLSNPLDGTKSAVSVYLVPSNNEERHISCTYVKIGSPSVLVNLAKKVIGKIVYDANRENSSPMDVYKKVKQFTNQQYGTFVTEWKQPLKIYF